MAARTQNGEEAMVVGVWYWAMFEGIDLREEEPESPYEHTFACGGVQKILILALLAYCGRQ